MYPGEIIGKYKLLAPLGEGSMGQVWKVTDTHGRIRALKTINQEYASDPQLRARFRFEAQRHLRLRQRNVVPTLESFEWRGNLFLAMEYIRGGSLANRLAVSPRRRLTVEDALSISGQVLGALNFIHEHFIVHRDVKPSNILLDGDHAYLADFGVALSIGGTRLTMFRRPIGTPEYMSPEQIQTPDQINHLSDVYSFGCVLYEMLAGRPPFLAGPEGSDFGYEVQSKHVNEIPDPVRKYNQDVPVRLERMIAVALEKDPSNRFPGCGSFARALGAVGKVVISVNGNGSGKEPEKKTKQPKVRDPRENGDQLRTTWITLGCSLAGMLLLPVALTHFRLLNPLLLLQTLVAFVTLAITIHRSWKAIQDGHAAIAPGRAVGLLFAPLYNFYWFYRVVPGFAKEFNGYAQRHKLDAQPLGRVWVVTSYILASMHLFASLLGWFNAVQKTPASVFMPIEFFDCFILIPTLTGMMLTARNRLIASAPAVPVAVGQAAAAV